MPALPVADRVYREPDLPASSRSYGRDSLTLVWDERVKPHARRRSDGGLEFGTALPRGTVLRLGDCLVLDAAGVVVVIREQLEPVFIIEPRTPREWGLVAYQIGNRHQPLMVTEGALVCPDLPGVEPLLRHLGLTYVRSRAAFTPATLAAGHDHRHAHADPR